MAGWAHEVGLNFQMARRPPGATLIVPAVMHWKVGHFAAIVKQSGGLYEVQDPTFGENIRVTRATMDEEASGYFVVPAGPLPKGWRKVTSAEGELSGAAAMPPDGIPMRRAPTISRASVRVIVAAARLEVAVAAAAVAVAAGHRRQRG